MFIYNLIIKSALKKLFFFIYKTTRVVNKINEKY